MLATIGALMAGKKIKGRKRHIVVDAQGRILHAEVHAANIHDTKGGIMPLSGAVEKFPSIVAVCADSGYRGTFELEAKEQLGIEVDIVERKRGVKWQVLPKRWVVERTFSWMDSYRRLCRNYEKYLVTAHDIFIAGCVCFMLRYFQ